MAGQYSVSELKKIVLVGAEALNVVSKIVHKQGVFVAFQLMDELSALSGLDGELLKKQVSELDAADRAELKQALKDKLVLQNPAMEQKIESGLDIVDESVEVVVSALKLVEKAKSLLS